MKTFSWMSCAIISAVFFYGCSKDPVAPPPQLSVDRSSLSVGVFQGYTDSFEVQSGASWELQLSPASAAEWMEVSTTHGEAGKTLVKISTIAAGATTQTATITIKPEGRETPSVDVTVTQKIYALDWKKIIGGEARDIPHSIVRTSDGGFVVAGSSDSHGSADIPPTNGNYDGFVMKLTATGTIEWSHAFGGNDDDELNSIATTPDGGYIVSGTSLTDNNGDITGHHWQRDAWVLKLNSAGEKVWSKCYGGVSEDEAKSIAVTPDGGYVMVGTTDTDKDGDLVEPNKGGTDLWVLKLDQSGAILWNKIFGGNGYDLGKSVVSTADGGIVIAGSTNSNDNSNDVGTIYGLYDGWLLKLDASGNMLWRKVFGGSDDEEFYSIASTPDNGFVLSGYSESKNSGDIGEANAGGNGWVLKVDAMGNKLWSKTYGGDSWEELFQVAVTTEGELLLTGYSTSDDNGDIGPNLGDEDLWLLRLNSMGNKLWSKTMGGDQSEDGMAVSPAGNGEFIVTASTFTNNNGDVGPGNGGTDIWLLNFK